MPRSEIDRLAHKIGRENTLQRTLHPIAPDTLKSLIHSKSPMFFRDSVRHLTRVEPEAEDISILTACSAIENLWLHCALRVLDPIDFTHQFFASIIHLEIFDIPNNLNPDDWPALTRLPHLTHLAFNSGNYLEMCLRFLSTWEALEALVVLLQENIGKKFLERYGVPQLALELRIVVIAEDFITKHKSREIDPLKYCIPEPDEDDYGQEDSEDEIDEDDGDDSPSSLFHDAGRLQPHLPSCLPVQCDHHHNLHLYSLLCTMPFGSQLAVNNEFNFVVGMDFGPTLMALFPSSTSTSTSQLGLSTDELTNDGVTVRINTNREDFAFDGGFDGGSRVAGDPSPSFAYNPMGSAPSAQIYWCIEAEAKHEKEFDGSANNRGVIANRPYMDTWLTRHPYIGSVTETNIGATDNVFPGAFIPAVARAAPTASAPGAFMSVFSVATNTVMQKRKRAEGDGVEKPARKHHLKRAPEAAPPP
ncbi:hypothetical protein B0H14DRAFT_3482001 [Mycena olivaceomarginata]|nr:hypothetical protein B0H14DRAFT_3482001 [Mycena olivaceomarginata]